MAATIAPSLCLIVHGIRSISLPPSCFSQLIPTPDCKVITPERNEIYLYIYYIVIYMRVMYIQVCTHRCIHCVYTCIYIYVCKHAKQSPVKFCESMDATQGICSLSPQLEPQAPCKQTRTLPQASGARNCESSIFQKPPVAPQNCVGR